MKFLLSEDQRALFGSVSDYVNDRCDAGVRRQAFESESGFDPDFWRGLMELGVGGIAAPETYGGLGLGLMDLALAAEALGFAGAPGPFLGHVLAIQAICTAGSEAQRELWLPRLVAGDAIATVALAEADDRLRPEQWNAESMAGSISGEKRDVLYPELADLTVVGVRGGFALVEREAVGQAFSSLECADRTRRLSHVSYVSTPAADERRLRQNARAVWWSHWTVPGAQTSVGRHGSGS
jgi:alkylation response protein AidB-like acyl-CoA dehydrogenase